MPKKLNEINVSEWKEIAKMANYRVGLLARRLGITVRKLERFFRQAFHCTPKEWLRQCQSELAIEMIKSGIPKKVIAYELGFSDPSHYHRAVRSWNSRCAYKRISL